MQIGLRSKLQHWLWWRRQQTDHTGHLWRWGGGAQAAGEDDDDGGGDDGGGGGGGGDIFDNR